MTVDMHWKQQNTSYFIATDMRERKDMFDFIYHSGITTKQNKSSIITEALLLSSSVDKSVNIRYNRIVKEALFEFLDRVNRAI